MPTKKNIQDPELLFDYFEQYKIWVKENPKKEHFFIPSLKKEISVRRDLPLTWDGFEIWLRRNKILSKLQDYKENKENRYTEYAYIIRAINQEIYQDKFTGAAVGLFNANIIARDLGLVDKKENSLELKGSKKIEDWLRKDND